MKCVKSVLGEFSSGVSVCRNKGTQSDVGAPLLPGPPRPGGTGPFLRLCADVYLTTFCDLVSVIWTMSPQ